MQDPTMWGAWWYITLGGVIVVPQVVAWPLRRRDSRFAGPIGSVTSISLRTFAAGVFFWIAWRFATHYSLWLIAPAVVSATIGVSSITLTILVVVANLCVALDREVGLPWLARLRSTPRRQFFVLMVSFPLLIATPFVAVAAIATRV